MMTFIRCDGPHEHYYPSDGETCLAAAEQRLGIWKAYNFIFKWLSMYGYVCLLKSFEIISSRNDYDDYIRLIIAWFSS